MREIHCEIIRDLLPLYVDDVCSEKSKDMIEEHLRGCEECRNYSFKIHIHHLLSR